MSLRKKLKLSVPDDAVPCEILIGRNFTELPHLAYVRVDDSLVFGYRKEGPFDQFCASNGDLLVKCRSAEKVTIPPHSAMWIRTNVNARAGDILATRDGLLLQAESPNCVTVPIMNYGREEVVLRKGVCVAKCELVEGVNNGVEVGRRSDMATEALLVLNGEKEADDITVRSDRAVAQVEQPTKSAINPNDVTYGSGLSAQTKDSLLDLINEYRDVVAQSLEELGCTTVSTVDIVELEGSKPPASRPYPASAADRCEINRIVGELRNAGLVTDTKSPYASPVLLVRKKNGDARLVVDYRRLNKQTVKQPYPMPNIDEQLGILCDARLFSSLDLAHGFFQIPLTDSAKEKTAFITQDGTGQFERLVFGLCNGPSEFQRAMDLALGPLRNNIAVCYIDDVLIPSRDESEMLQRVRMVFEALREARLTLRLSKCVFGMTSVAYLGFVISEGGVRPGPDKVRAIVEFGVPDNVHKVRQFLGLVGFFRRFVKNFSAIAEPLTNLTSIDVPFAWSDSCQAAFDKLKSVLVNDPVLKLYDPKAETQVHTDASQTVLAGMLLQRGSDNNWHLVYCVSKKTTKAEQSYHSTRLELLAVVWTLERLRSFLMRIHFTLITDCQALSILNSQKSKSPQIVRWLNLLSEYDFEMRHRAGNNMSHVDCLSRNPVEVCEQTIDSILERRHEVLLTVVQDEVLLVQRSDPFVKKLIDIFDKAEIDRSPEERRLLEGYKVEDGYLYRKVTHDGVDRFLFVMPPSMRKSLVVFAHDMNGHFGVERTVSKILERFWFAGMRAYVKFHISRCLQCILSKRPSGKQAGLLNPLPIPSRPFEVLHVDHVGPFVTSSKGNTCILVVADRLSKYARLFAEKGPSAKCVLTDLKHFFLERGLPRRIISDRGTAFTSRVFGQFCEKNGISHTLSSPRHPQTNGQVERVNRILVPVVMATIEREDTRDWDKRLLDVERCLNNSVHRSMGKTPFEVIHGYRPEFHLGALRLVEINGERWNPPQDLWEETKQRLMDEQEKSKAYYDARHYQADSYDVGNLVYIVKAPEVTGSPTKFQRKYIQGSASSDGGFAS